MGDQPTECELCMISSKQERERDSIAEQQRKEDKKMISKTDRLFRKPFPEDTPPKAGEYAIVPDAWYTLLIHYLQTIPSDEPGPIPTSELACEHNLLAYAPYPIQCAKSFETRGTESGKMRLMVWSDYVMVKAKYGGDAIDFKLNCSVPKEGANLMNEWERLALDIQPGLCKECISKRTHEEQQKSLQYVNGTIHFQECSFGPFAEATNSKRPRRTTRSKKSGALTLQLSDSDSISQVKLMVLQSSDSITSVGQLVLYYEGQELRDMHKTLRDYEVPNKATIQYKLDLDRDPSEDSDLYFSDVVDRGPEQGFVGSILVGSSPVIQLDCVELDP
eukprot:TRINITY_DN9442_c0_g1_i17.p1 TRINITY_DN9442_c0_g1~~TRINITY_DN9442_c0_g1_i17.p1  ORF type:complete len:343 (-),score=37.47 TRINITY_DN9442_c0_g1_i17:187-1185(-)